jgi:hypothetical protein
VHGITMGWHAWDLGEYIHFVYTGKTFLLQTNSSLLHSLSLWSLSILNVAGAVAVRPDGGATVPGK